MSLEWPKALAPLALSLALSLPLSVPALRAQGGAEQRIRILATADTRAEILPRDTYTMSPANLGWARLATAIGAERAGGGATLLLDCGNALHGSPLAYIQNRMHPGSPNAAVEIMNSLGYGAMSPGDRDFDFGAPAAKGAESQAAFPFLAANVLDPAGNQMFAPFTKVALGGVSVAVLGLSALSPHPAYFVRDAVETAMEWAPRLRNKEKADAVVVLMHAGRDGEEAVRRLAGVPGVDAVVASPPRGAAAAVRGGAPVARPSPHGRSLASVTLSFQRQGRQWALKSAEPADVPLDPALALDPTVLRLTEALRRETEDYLDTFATRLGADLDGRWSTVEPTALLQLIHDVQKKATGAQLSAAPSPGTHIFVQNGPTSVRQFYALAPHENRVAKIRITGAQLRAYLEHAAGHFNYSYLPELTNRSVPVEDYDTVSGCGYALDISRPPGKRVSGLRHGGAPVEDSQVFTMALPSSRLAGAGGYMDAIGFGGRAEAVTRESLRNLLLEHVLAAPTLNIAVDGGWRTIPFLDRDRVLAAYR